MLPPPKRLGTCSNNRLAHLGFELFSIFPGCVEENLFDLLIDGLSRKGLSVSSLVLQGIIGRKLTNSRLGGPFQTSRAPQLVNKFGGLGLGQVFLGLGFVGLFRERL
jgi:hypothetical protein